MFPSHAHATTMLAIRDAVGARGRYVSASGLLPALRQRGCPVDFDELRQLLYTLQGAGYIDLFAGVEDLVVTLRGPGQQVVDAAWRCAGRRERRGHRQRRAPRRPDRP